MVGFVYLWYDLKKKRFYIGSHWGEENDGYICSSNWMKQAYKRRPETFKRRILAWVSSSRRELLDEEFRWLNMIDENELGTRYYNLAKRVGHWHADEDRLRTTRERLKKAQNDPETNARRSASIKEAIARWTPEQRAARNAKLSASLKGRKQPPRTEEHKRNNREANKKAWAEGRNIGRTGSPLSEESRGRLREMNLGPKNPMYGKRT